MDPLSPANPMRIQKSCIALHFSKSFSVRQTQVCLCAYPVVCQLSLFLGSAVQAE